MSYVDGFVVPVPKDKVEAYRQLATTAGNRNRELIQQVVDEGPWVGQRIGRHAASRRLASSSDHTESMNGRTFGATAASSSYTVRGAISK